MEVKCGETHCEITMQHWQFGDFIGGKRISTYTILKMFEQARFESTKLYGNIFGSTYKFTRFMKWQQLDILPEFYGKKINHSFHRSYFDVINRKTKLCYNLLPIGNTSQMTKGVVMDFDTETPLFVLSGLAVNIDPATRRPAPFPDSLKRHFTPEKCKNHKKIVQNVKNGFQNLFEFNPADGIFHNWNRTVSIHFIDSNNHVNQAAFVDICYECVGDAFSKSVFGKTGSVLNYDIRRISVLYLKEMTLGDAVVTTVWKDKMDSLVYKFHVKKDSVVTCQAEIEFYQPGSFVKSNL